MDVTTHKSKLPYPAELMFYLLTFGVYLYRAGACNVTNPPTVWDKMDYPNPRVDTGRCGRNCTMSWMCDPSNILTQNEADDLDSILDSFYKSGYCPCPDCPPQEGYEMYIALMAKMKIPSGTSKTVAASHFSYELRTTWVKRSCGNIVVILVSRDDRQVYTAVGPAAFKVLNLDCIQRVYSKVKPLLTKGSYYSGLKEMLQLYNETFSTGSCSVKEEAKEESGMGAATIFLIVFFSLSGGALFVPIIIFCCPDICDPYRSPLCCCCKDNWHYDEESSCCRAKSRNKYGVRSPPVTYSSPNRTSKFEPSQVVSYTTTSGSAAHTNHTSSLHHSTSYSHTSSANSGGCDDSGFSGGGCSDGGGGGGGDF